MIKTIKFKGVDYPAFQANGNAARFAIPFASEVCKGVGYDVGCGKLEWAFPGAIPIDLSFNNGYDANNLPEENVDYIFSSHLLEHVPNWVNTLDYWETKLNPGGTLFLYLPDYSQEYWRPWNNRKHFHIFNPQIIKDYLAQSAYSNNFFVGSPDLYNSFMVMAEKD